MTEANSKKCTYFNSGYCKFTRKENGCRYAHPTESCTIIKCNDKRCPFRHPKKCRHGDQCIYQTNCMYKHYKDTSTVEKNDNSNGDKIQYLTIEVETLKSQIGKLKEENDDKIKTLVRIHALELSKFQEENNTLRENISSLNASKKKDIKEAEAKEIIESKDNYQKEVNELTTQNEDIVKKVASSESLNFALTKKTEELVKINTYVKALEAQNKEVKDIVHKGNSQKAQIKIKYDNLIKIIADKDNEITLQTKQIQELKALVE